MTRLHYATDLTDIQWALLEALLPDWVQEELDCVRQPVLRPVDVDGFVVLPKHWIVDGALS